MFRCRIYAKTNESGKITFADLWDQPGILELADLSKEDGWEFMVVIENEDKPAIQRLIDAYLEREIDKSIKTN